MPLNPVGVIGGSGFYSLLEDAGAVDSAVNSEVDSAVDGAATTTRYGAPSGPLTAGRLAERDVVFLPRHGVDHRFAPHVVPYRANLWALRAAGVRQVISLSAVGSLTPSLPTGTLVVPDQVVDRTSGRPHTYFGEGSGVGHVSFADPFCPAGRTAAISADLAAVDGGTLVVVNGPRFSSRAESREFQSHGWSIIGMTAMPEAALARELGLCYTTLALVTDLDAGVEAGEGVTHAEVLAAFAENLPRLRELLVATLAALPETQAHCACGDLAALPRGFVLP